MIKTAYDMGVARCLEDFGAVKVGIDLSNIRKVLSYGGDDLSRLLTKAQAESRMAAQDMYLSGVRGAAATGAKSTAGHRAASPATHRLADGLTRSGQQHRELSRRMLDGMTDLNAQSTHGLGGARGVARRKAELHTANDAAFRARQPRGSVTLPNPRLNQELPKGMTRWAGPVGTLPG